MGNKIKKTDDVKRGYVNIFLVTYPSYINGTRADAPHVANKNVSDTFSRIRIMIPRIITLP